jgi:hypothetical protein
MAITGAKSRFSDVLSFDSDVMIGILEVDFCKYLGTC